jgi:hypothetical protein
MTQKRQSELHNLMVQLSSLDGKFVPSTFLFFPLTLLLFFFYYLIFSIVAYV